jgi:hypothetical protein
MDIHHHILFTSPKTQISQSHGWAGFLWCYQGGRQFFHHPHDPVVAFLGGYPWTKNQPVFVRKVEEIEPSFFLKKISG